MLLQRERRIQRNRSQDLSSVYAMISEWLTWHPRYHLNLPYPLTPRYVPSLRELRQHALVLIFPVTEQSRLAQRLHEVCKKEHLRTNLTALSTLCEKAYNDIRSCLNTLQVFTLTVSKSAFIILVFFSYSQFLQRRHKEITISLIRTTSIGQKDAQKSLFALWKDIFQLPSGKK